MITYTKYKEDFFVSSFTIHKCTSTNTLNVHKIMFESILLFVYCNLTIHVHTSTPYYIHEIMFEPISLFLK